MSVPHKQCPRCKEPAPLEAPQCLQCGHAFRTNFLPPAVPPNDRTQAYSPQGERLPNAPQYPAPLPPAAPPQVYQAPPEYPVYQQQQPAPYPVRQKTDLCAVLSLALAGVGIFLFPCAFGPAAVILGAVSLVRIKDNPELGGLWLAVTGLVAGGIWTLYSSITLLNAIQNLPQ